VTRPIYEPNLERKDAELGYGSDQLFRRPAPTSTSVISMAQYAVDNFSLSASGAIINWSSINTTFDAGNHFDLTGGADPEINDAGIYAFHFKFHGLSGTNTKSCTLFLSMDVLSGSNGLWSSQSVGDDMDAEWLIQFRDDSAIDITTGDDYSAYGYGAWATTDTFPIVTQWYCQYSEDNVGVDKSPDFKLTIVRFGLGDEAASS
jgi:hypothetical protein